MFNKKLKDYVKLIDVNLNKSLPHSNKFCNNFIESLKYGVLNGGKRLRPVLTLAICELFHGNLNAASLLACSVEFIHAGSLIHDDLPCMDNAQFRRGISSCHVKFGEAIAVLAGDGLFLSAFNLITESKNFGLSSDKIVKACGVLSKMAGFNGMVLGQAIDMTVKNDFFDESVVKILASLKTACLIRAACVLGVIASDANDEIKNKIDKFASYVGLAFQIYDDLTDFDDESKNNLDVTKKEKLNYMTVFKNRGELISKAESYVNRALKEIAEFKNNEFLNYLVNFIFSKFRCNE